MDDHCLEDHCLENEQLLCLRAGDDCLLRCACPSSFSGQPLEQDDRPGCFIDGRFRARSLDEGYEQPRPSCLTPDGMVRQPVRPLWRTLVMHVCLMMLAMTNITSGILIANEHYDRLPGPLLLSLLFSIFCAVFQDTAER